MRTDEDIRAANRRSHSSTRHRARRRVVTTARALKRLLESRGLTFTDLGDGIEKLATGGLTQAAMEQIRDASYAKGIADTERKHAEVEGVYGLRSDGSTDWEAIALAASGAKTVSTPGIINSSTIWPRA